LGLGTGDVHLNDPENRDEESFRLNLRQIKVAGTQIR
jgi:hypothetical protein